MSMKKRPDHAPMSQFPVANNCLVVGGVPLPQLAQRIGRTPFYVYDRRLIQDRVQSLRRTLPAGVGLHYAIKANPMPAVVQLMSQLVDGLDVASLGELHIALDCSLPSQRISFAGPGKCDAELSAALASGIVVNLESETEMERLAGIGERSGHTPRVAVRVNPDFELKSSGIRMAGGAKPFGIDAERIPSMLRRLGTLELEFLGFHIYSGSQSLRVDSLIEAQNETFALAFRLAEHAPQPITLLNIGGGFGIPYFPGEARLDLDPLAANLDACLVACRSRLPEAEVVLELGRYLVGEAGLYVCRIIDRKLSRGRVFLITDGGLHHHLAASGNFGQVVRRNYPMVIGNRVHSDTPEEVSVVGPLCTPLDILGDRVELAEAAPGDFVAVYQSGAYGRSASPLGFLGHPPPLEVMV